MAAFALTAAGTLWDDNDISCFVDTLTLDGTAAMLPTTTMCAGGFEQFTPGVASFTSAFEGPVDYASGAIGQYVTPADVGRLTPISTFPLALPANVAAGDPTIIANSRVVGSKLPTGDVSTVARWSMDFKADTPQMVGKVAAPLAQRTTAGFTGTAVALTGPSATQKLYAALHVTAAAGTNLVVTIQSDDNSGFTSPTVRATFATVSATTALWTSVAGSLATETHWRAVATIATGTFTFAVTIAVA